MTEIWKPIEWTEGRYEASDLGRVRITRAGKRYGRVLKPMINRLGYEWVELGLGSRTNFRRILVHHLIAEVFLGPRPSGLCVCHKDGNQKNNTPSNLYYGTMADNMRDRDRHGRTARGGDRHGKAKLTEQAVREIVVLSDDISLREIGRIYGVTHQSICQILSGKSWSHVTGIVR